MILRICTQKADFLCMSSWLCTNFWIICADRYVVTLPQLVDEVAELSARVEAYLQRMGAKL